ncbi:MAG: HAMP domain-containing histidine kinase [Lachnospiraceae bacterium]|nr:HAMP domain-containing histidine kinase [Lachnospiraceae bacterium]
MNKLRKRMIIVFTILLAAIYLTVLLSVNIFNYSSNLRQQRRQIRSLISRVSLDEFCLEEPTDGRLEDMEYCAVKLPKDGEPEILANYLGSYSEEKVMKYSRRLSRKELVDGNIGSLVYVIKYSRKLKNHIVVFMNNDFAVENSKNLIIFSVVAFVFGMVILFAISVLLSKWLMHPAERHLQIEKEFISNASHELKTPLTIIGANAELLKNEYGDNEQLVYIKHETEKMSHLIGEMLTLVRMDSAVREDDFMEFNLSEMMMEVVLPFESVAFEHKLTMDFQIAEGLCCYGSREQLQRVLSILLDNAMSYTPSGGEVMVSLHAKGRKLYLVVSNSGDEIPMALKEKIFERFYRQDESRESEGNSEGTRHFGLGLSIADSIVKRHHGVITVESTEGKNIFTVILPAGHS